MTTIEGLLRDIAKDLGIDQPLRRIESPETYKKIQSIIDAFQEIVLDTDDDDEDPAKAKLQKEDKVAHPFTVRLDDPTGNSWVEFYESMADPKWDMRQYNRTAVQNEGLGLAKPDKEEDGAIKEGNEDEGEGEALKENEEILVFPGQCSSCSAPLDTMMKRVSIPYFKVRPA